MCYDPQSETFYVLGRYVNALEDDPLMLESDLFKYDLKTHCWTKLSRNTADDGGPDLVFDHQMCINTQTQTLYVCGGKILGVNGGSPEYSGLYSYDIISQQWSVLRMGDPDRMNVDSLINRAGHSMFMDTTNNCLYLFSGQRAHECFYDLFKYNISTGVFENIDHGNKEEFSREAGFTHRVTFDEKRQEIYIFASYTRSTKWEKIKNSFYVYSIKSNTWEVVFENENMGGRRPSLNSPLPRYAHQMVYDPTTDVHYIFGGNPGNQQGENTRLNDLWELKLKKPNSPNVYCQCLFMVRAQRLRELCMETMTKKKISIALDYLRTHVTPLVDYEDQKQVNELERLCSQVCFLGDSTYEKMSEGNNNNNNRN
ncbi:hypothetical protein G6F56_009538 [Rhizopus delemar]|nr:hypothetical protein G6F56_009538 [Rhizopus delemar]